VTRTLHVPVIAAVNGHAIGGGLEMVLGCDIVVAAEGARFGLSEPRVGRIPLDGGVFQLVRQLPYRLAMSMLLTGQQISAAEAYRYGLINEVVARERFAEAVQRWVDEVLACAPLSLRAIKEMVLRAEAMRVEDATRMRLPWLIEALDSDDAVEGVRAFREKRKPVWRAS
jgi:crotonobetainyl-CoA hydratase